MTIETKRDVFDETLSNLKKMDAQIEGEFGYSQLTMGVGKHGDVESTREIAIAEIRDRYAAALPDDLPVIPKAVGDVIVKLKYKRFSLSGAMSYAAVVSLSPWMTSENEDTFARAWVLGVWRVEETGEVVKL